MAIMNSSQIAAELQRKRNLKIAPTSKANLTAYNGLNAQKPPVKLGTAPAPTTPKVNEGYSGVRSFFEGNGYKDVGWNPNSRMVTVGGVDALAPGQSINGTSYASGDALNSALSRVKDREANTKNSDLMTRLEAAMSKPYETPQFNYDPTTDPAYQSALSRAQANAQTASGNAMAELNRRGILNSTITGDRLGQIEQSEYGRVSDTILPQLMTQAYNRHRDSVSDAYTQNRDGIKDLADMLGINVDLGQQRLDNANTERDYNRGVFEYDDTTAYNRGQDTKEEERYNKEYEDTQKQKAIDNAIAQQNANRSSGGGGSSGGSSGTKEVNLNTVIDNINSLYTQYNKDSGGRNVTNSSALKQYIDSIGLPDSQRQQLYNYYGISGNGGSGDTNFWDTIKGVLSGAVKGTNTSGSSVSDDDINKYLK